MPIHADQNLYPGINAHLNSYLQNTPSDWEGFHNHHISHLLDYLDPQLPQGYLVRSEKSLQISENVFLPGSRPSRVKPDITIYKSGISRTYPGQQGASASAAQPVATVPIFTPLADEDYLTGLIIYQEGEGSPLGRPITRIELLSPANKPGGSHHKQYMINRWQTLQSGLRLVEIDYLHQKAPILDNLADYTKAEEGAFPYVILVSDPRPSFEKGTTRIYGYSVTDKIPVVSIPLAGADNLPFDFGAVYHHTFSRLRFYHTVADYEQEPVAFEYYIEADRALIRQLLAEIRANQE